jgi:lipoprotein-releasing system permease protein
MWWFLVLAYRHLFPIGKPWGSYFARVSVLGVALGVMVVLVVQTVMNGFHHDIMQKMIQTHGHIQIETGGVIGDTQQVEKVLKKIPQVQTFAPYAQGIVMVQYQGRPAFPAIRGVDLSPDKQVLPLSDFLIEGSLDDLNDHTVLISSLLAAQLGVSLGQTLEVYTPFMLEKLKQDEVLLPLELKVAGIFRTGWNQVDYNTLMCTLPRMQDLYGLGDGVHGVAIKLKPSADPLSWASKLNKRLPVGFKAYSWLDIDKDLFFILSVEKYTLFFIMLFIILVASFAIASSLMTNIVRKTREIGLLQAIGASSDEIFFCFSAEGFLIGLLGTLIGLGAGVLVIEHREYVIKIFSLMTHQEADFIKYYQLVDIPAHYRASDFAIIFCSSILMCTIASLFPAIQASHFKPADSLRSE